MTLVDVITIGVYVLTVLSIMAVLFLERKDPASTLIWILLLNFLPVIGVILYFFLGRGLKVFTVRKLRLRKEARQRFRNLPPKIQDYFSETLAVVQGRVSILNEEDEGRFRSLVAMNLHFADAMYTTNNALTIYTSAQEKYEALFADIRGARETINIMYFIISNNDMGHRLISLLAEKAREGVKVYLIYDELGSITTPGSMFNELRRAGGKVYRFFPLKLGSLLRANYRNHHKIVVIDGKIAYTGGMNIGDEYLGLNPKKSPWRDTHTRLTGDSVMSLQFLFFLDLYYATEDEKFLLESMTPTYFPEPEQVGSIGMQIVGSGPDADVQANKRALVKMISSAKRSVYVQSPYLMPDSTVLEALQNAACSGVDVMVMLPGIPDKKIVYYVTTSYIQDLLDYGIRVYLYRGFLHAKMLVVDDTVCTIGTTNLDMRSFTFHFEVNNYIFDKAIAVECGDIFRQDMENSDKVVMEVYQARGRFRKFLEGILRLFAPLM